LALASLPRGAARSRAGRKAPRKREDEHGGDNGGLEQVRSKVKEGTSALFLLLGQVTTDRVVEAFKAGPKFEIIASNLSHEQEDKLKAAFAS
jgi:uncharacterized membrane protein